ncbi:MAG: hypothetical protein C4344_03030, partial [Acidimicrobiia bacterium]
MTMIAALEDEVAAQRADGGARIDVHGGQLIDDFSEVGTYCFDLSAEVFLPEGIPVQLVVGGRRYDAEVLHRDADALYLLVTWSVEAG